MKKNLFVLAMLVATGFTTASASAPLNVKKGNSIVVAAAPPTAVLKAFTSMFGNVGVKEWKFRSNGQWRAHFVKNGIRWEATFSSTGALVKSEPE